MGTSLSEGNRRIAMCHLGSTLPMMAKGKIFAMQPRCCGGGGEDGVTV